MQINISSKDVRTFGGFSLFVAENNINISECELVTSGEFSFDCVNEVATYLAKNKLHLKSFTYSKDYKIAYIVSNYLIAKKIIIPEGVLRVENMLCLYDAENCKDVLYLDEMKLPSSLLEVKNRAFIKYRVDNIEIDNFYFKKDKVSLINTFTKENVLFFNLEKKQSVKGNNDVKQKATRFDVTFCGTEFWIKNYYQIKQQLKPVQFNFTNKNPLNELVENLMDIPDFFDSWEVEQKYSFKYFFLIAKLKEIILNCDVGYDMNPILLYTSYSFVKDKDVKILFELDHSGINMIIPDLNMFLPFKKDELNLIHSYLDYLETNLYDLLQQQKGTEIFLSLQEKKQLDDKDRENILNML